jgi:hypothetical protein
LGVWERKNLHQEEEERKKEREREQLIVVVSAGEGASCTMERWSELIELAGAEE